MTIRRSALAVLLPAILFAAVQTASGQAVTIPGHSLDGKELKLPGVLHKPDGDGPFPAIVMLSGCAGYSHEPDAAQQSTWAQRFTGWGYVALQVDSFSPRGNPDGVCDNPSALSPMERAVDAFSAKTFLSGLAYIDPERIVVIGWSHGGWTAMTIIDSFYRDKGVRPFTAAVAFYPYCNPVYKPDTPVLVLIGRKDDWCPASLAESVKRDYDQHPEWKSGFTLKVYPNATHAFDFESTPAGGVDFLSHHVAYDPDAASDAISMTREFLAKYLKE